LSEIAAKHGAMKVSELIAMQKTSLAEKLKKNPKLLKAGDELTVLVDRGVVGAFAPPDEDKGFLKVGIALEAGKHYFIKRPHLAFGTGHTIKAIKAAISRYLQQKGIKGGPQIHVGDISARGGGPLKGHKSHQKGIDVDVGLVLKGDDAGEVRFLTGRADNLDVGRTWSLIKAFIDTNEVRSVFLDYGLQKLLYEHAKKKGVSEGTLDELFQYPRGKGRGFGIIRHWKGHRDHFHVRFKR
jgi:murein endopeptidase